MPYSRDWYTVFCLLMAIGLLWGPYFIDLGLLAGLVWVFFSCLLNFISNLINHNHSHVPTFTQRWANELVNVGLLLIRGAPVSFIEIIHNINHHGRTNQEEDWFWSGNQGKGRYFFRPWKYIWTTALRFKRGAKKYYGQLGGRFKKRQWRERFILYPYMAFLLACDWKIFLFYVFLPWNFGNMFLVLTNLLFHRNCVPGKRYEVSYNFKSPLENLLFLNGGYHTVHHLDPKIHWSQLPTQHQLKVAPHMPDQYMRQSMFKDLFELYFLRGLNYALKREV